MMWLWKMKRSHLSMGLRALLDHGIIAESIAHQSVGIN